MAVKQTRRISREQKACIVSGVLFLLYALFFLIWFSCYFSIKSDRPAVAVIRDRWGVPEASIIARAEAPPFTAVLYRDSDGSRQIVVLERSNLFRGYHSGGPRNADSLDAVECNGLFRRTTMRISENGLTPYKTERLYWRLVGLSQLIPMGIWFLIDVRKALRPGR